MPENDAKARRRAYMKDYMAQYRRADPERTLRQRLRTARGLLERYGFTVSGEGDLPLDVHTEEHGEGGGRRE